MPRTTVVQNSTKTSLLVISIFAVSMFLAASAQAGMELSPVGEIEQDGSTFTQKFECNWKFKSDGSLSVANTNGNIAVEAWDKPEIAIEVKKQLRLKNSWWGKITDVVKSSSKDRDQAAELLQDLAVQFKGDEKTLDIKTVFPKNSKDKNYTVHYSIRVPGKINLDLATSNGSVSIDNIKGVVKLETVNGKLNCANIQGNLSADTCNGSVVAKNVTGNIEATTLNGKIDIEYDKPPHADDKLACKTTNGSIEVRLPENSSFDIQAKTTNGHISSEFPVKVSGNFIGKHASDTVGKGGADINLTVLNGKISLKKSPQVKTEES